MQLLLADLMAENYERKLWTPPKREILRLRETRAEVRPIYNKGNLAGREQMLSFLRQHHYLHQAPGSKEPNFTWGFGLFLHGELAGLAALNPPAAGVPTRYFGKSSAFRRGLIGISRVCCHPGAPFNSESLLVSSVLRLLPKLDHRFHTVIAQSDLSVMDPQARSHVGTIYMGANGWWAGYSTSKQWRGFIDPETGATESRWCGGRERKKSECPKGWQLNPGTQLTNFLWFVSRREAEARQSLLPSVKVMIRQGTYPLWRRPAEIGRGTPRAYSERDKALRVNRDRKMIHFSRLKIDPPDQELVAVSGRPYGLPSKPERRLSLMR